MCKLHGLFGPLVRSNFRFCFIDIVCMILFSSQVCQISLQPPVNGELILRFQQLQSRLATLKIENEEVKLCRQISMWNVSVLMHQTRND